MAKAMRESDALTRLRMYIDGEWTESSSGEHFESFDPYTAKPWTLVPKGNAEDVDRAVQAAHRAFTTGDWPKMHPSQRGALLRKVGDLIARDAERLGALEVRDNGKLISEMVGQLRYAPQWYYYFGGMADKVEGSVIETDKPAFTYTRHEPLGVCAAITPWNSPVLLFTWKVAPALAAGNTIVIKPSEHTSASTLELMNLFEEAGFPKGVINVVTGFGPDTGEHLVKHPLVRKIAFTGSSKTGAHVYSLAAQDIKRVSLELGGKSPNIVFDDCNMENAVKGVVSGIFAATGQTCIAGSRLLVQESIHDEFVERLVEFAKTARMGNPMDYETQVGPVTNLMQYEKVLGYIDIAKSEGVETVLGGAKATRPECGDGWFVEPTVFT
ncbi:MAG: aldehyde dehydrogenase, partial [Gammaproteobacteria bacterium]|nr:aldehyde dehydrogenase [Gammaproteobacteria bacterium]